MSDIIPKPSPAQVDEYAHLSDREILIGLLVRNNAEAVMLRQMAEQLPETLRNPLIQMAIRKFFK